MSDEPTTCGQGLAHHAVLPSKMSAVTAGMAGVLEDHLRSITVSEPEYAAYSTLVADYRALTTALQRVAERMEGYRDLPMATHDETVLSSPESAAAFEAFTQAERELRAILGTG